LDPGGTTVAVSGYTFDSNGGGSVTTQSGCGIDHSLSSCTALNDILYTSGGKHVASLKAQLSDGSAFCDKLTVDVRTTTITAAPDVTTSPSRHTFSPGESVTLRVRLHNTSPAGSGGNILITGNAASCQTEVKVGASTLSKTTQIDLRHCSSTVGQPCE